MILLPPFCVGTWGVSVLHRPCFREPASQLVEPSILTYEPPALLLPCLHPCRRQQSLHAAGPTRCRPKEPASSPNSAHPNQLLFCQPSPCRCQQVLHAGGWGGRAADPADRWHQHPGRLALAGLWVAGLGAVPQALWGCAQLPRGGVTARWPFVDYCRLTCRASQVLPRSLRPLPPTHFTHAPTQPNNHDPTTSPPLSQDLINVDRLSTNNPAAMLAAYGVEACRATIVKEVRWVCGAAASCSCWLSVQNPLLAGQIPAPHSGTTHLLTPYTRCLPCLVRTASA